MFAFDQWILDTCEKFSHRTQRTFGLTCFSLARGCLGVAPIVYAFPLIFDESNFWLFVMMFFSGLILSALYLPVTYIYEKKVFEFSLHGLANPFRSYLRLRRFIIFLTGNLTMAFFPMQNVSFVLSLEAWLLALIVHLYFLSCDPLPPAKSKVRAFIEKIRESLSPTEIPTPQES